MAHAAVTEECLLYHSPHRRVNPAHHHTHHAGFRRSRRPHTVARRRAAADQPAEDHTRFSSHIFLLALDFYSISYQTLIQHLPKLGIIIQESIILSLGQICTIAVWEICQVKGSSLFHWKVNNSAR